MCKSYVSTVGFGMLKMATAMLEVSTCFIDTVDTDCWLFPWPVSFLYWLLDSRQFTSATPKNNSKS